MGCHGRDTMEHHPLASHRWYHRDLDDQRTEEYLGGVQEMIPISEVNGQFCLLTFGRQHRGAVLFQTPDGFDTAPSHLDLVLCEWEVEYLLGCLYHFYHKSFLHNTINASRSINKTDIPVSFSW